MPIISVFDLPEDLGAGCRGCDFRWFSKGLCLVHLSSLSEHIFSSLSLLHIFVDEAKEFHWNNSLHWNPNVSLLGPVKQVFNRDEKVFRYLGKILRRLLSFIPEIWTFKENVHCKANLKPAEVLWWSVCLGLSPPTPVLLLDNVTPWLFQIQIFQVSQESPGVFS